MDGSLSVLLSLLLHTRAGMLSPAPANLLSLICADASKYVRGDVIQERGVPLCSFTLKFAKFKSKVHLFGFEADLSSQAREKGEMTIRQARGVDLRFAE